jgi:hydroxyacylglutathione hydrolase
MLLERIKSEIVAQISYFIGSAGEALVVDPRRDCRVYIDIARREGMTIKHVFETHRNEDYVIGSLELASLTGAEIYHGPWPEFEYGETLKDGEESDVGNLKVRAIHTPGHTPGCMSYAITDLDTGEQPVLVCTGDVLFINEVGRTDLGGPERQREWSGNLYDSIFNRLLPLGDQVILCPAHGSGSICGSDIAEREQSTLGIERLQNPLLQLPREKFIEHKTREHHEYPPYYRIMEGYNLRGAPFVGCGPTPKPLSPDELLSEQDKDALLVDTSSPLAFSSAHVRKAYNIPKSHLSFAGWLLPYDKPVNLVVEDIADLEYVVNSLSRIGYDNVVGYLRGGMYPLVSSGHPYELLPLLKASDLKAKIEYGEKLTLLDVRSLNEWNREHLTGAQHIYVGHLLEQLEKVSKKHPVITICSTGKRASIAASILQRCGWPDVLNLLGGMEAWEALKYPIER